MKWLTKLKKRIKTDFPEPPFYPPVESDGGGGGGERALVPVSKNDLNDDGVKSGVYRVSLCGKKALLSINLDMEDMCCFFLQEAEPRRFPLNELSEFKCDHKNPLKNTEVNHILMRDTAYGTNKKVEDLAGIYEALIKFSKDGG